MAHPFDDKGLHIISRNFTIKTNFQWSQFIEVLTFALVLNVVGVDMDPAYLGPAFAGVSELTFCKQSDLKLCLTLA